MSNYSKSTTNVQKLSIMGMLCAVAFVSTMLMHSIPIMPSAPYLSLDPKDAVIAIGGFIFGPVAALIMTAAVCLVEMVTISSTGVIGLVMNLLPKFKNAVIGLILGVISMTVMMILWNYLITPIYTGMDRAVIAPMLPTVFLPFNLLKGTINAALTLFLYKSVVTVLRKAKLLPKNESKPSDTAKGEKPLVITPLVMISSIVILVTCILIILVINGKL